MQEDSNPNIIFTLLQCSLVGLEGYAMPLFLGINYKGPLDEIFAFQIGIQVLKVNLALVVDHPLSR